MTERNKLRKAVVNASVCTCLAIVAFTLVLPGALAYSVTVTTDRSSYNRGDLVSISGTITPTDEGVYVGIETDGPAGSTVWIDMVRTDSSGNFASQFRLDPSAPYGVYTVWATPHASNSTAWCQFTIPETTGTTTVATRTATVIIVVTSTVPETTITRSVATVTIGTTETTTSKETASITFTKTETRTAATKETTSTTLTKTETETTTVSSFDIVQLVKSWLGEPVAQLTIPILLLAVVVPGVFIFVLLTRRRKEKRRRKTETPRPEDTGRMEQ